MTQVSVSFAELYEAMQRGLMECVDSVPGAGFMANGLWEVGKYFTPSVMSGTAGLFFLFSKDTWDGLPDLVKEAINEAKAVFIRTFAQEELKAYSRWATEAPEMGVEFLDGAELREAVNSYKDTVRAGLVASAPAGVSDPEAAIDAYVASLNEWLATTEEDFGIPAEPIPGDTADMIEAYVATDDLDWGPFQKSLQAQAELFAK
jgi:TRAP-type mannitol/chloroaromatic compound transport system substrate-binding protein